MSAKQDFPSLNNIRPLNESHEISIAVFTPRAVHTDSMIAPVNYFRAVREQIGTKSMIMDLTFMSSQKRKRSNRTSEYNSSHSKMGADMIAVKETYLKHDKEIEELKDNT